jgi:ComF family protein
MSTWSRDIRRIGNAGLTLLFPRACDLCGGSVEAMRDGVACANCWKETELFDSSVSFCFKCGAPREGGGVAADGCRECAELRFTAARALGPYAGALRASVLALKRKPETGGRLLELLAELAASAPLDQADLVSPVPLHAERERERGFNQAAVVASGVARRRGLPVDETSLVRTEHTARHRAEMDARARRESVENVFAVPYPRRVRGRSILLIDDVFTTGATLSACALVLFDAGASQVFVLTIARAR